MQLNIRSVSQTVQKCPGELKFQGEVIFQEHQDIGYQLVFSVNETLFFHEKSEN